MVTKTGFGAGEGWRMQLHRRGSEVQFWSRRGVEHGASSSFHVLASLVEAQVRAQEVVLDGELVVWNTLRCRSVLSTFFLGGGVGVSSRARVSVRQEGGLWTVGRSCCPWLVGMHGTPEHSRMLARAHWNNI